MYRGIVIVLCLILINSILTVINDSTIGNQTLSTMPKIMFTYKPQVRSTMDEGKTLEILKALAEQATTDEAREQILGCIHTREYVDETELENLIYNDVVSKESLEPAMLTKTIFVLNLRRSRKKQ